MSLMFMGIGVSRGIAIGEVHVLRRNQIDVAERHLPKAEVAGEVRRLKRALKSAREQLLTARDTIPEDAPSDISAFIETHILMLDDSLLAQRPIEIIRTSQCNAEAALQQQREALGKVFGSMEDDYLATRVDDVNHVIDTVMRALQGSDAVATGDEIPVWKGHIVVADDLSPADTVLMQHHGVAGFITETGGQLSHTAILARSLGIPAIVGLSSIRNFLQSGETISVDGHTGMVLAEPTDEILAEMRRQQKADRAGQRELAKLIDTPAITDDKVPVTLMANIEIEEDIKALKKINAAGVGLYRTEFLYLNRDTAPDEAEHLRVYTKVLRALKGAPLTIRTADLGADKVHRIATLGRNAQALSPAHNPALGLRGIRLCLSDQSLFMPQIRAILRASAKGPVRILLPMITTVGEVRQAQALIEQARHSLTQEGIAFDPEVPVGGMIEVPAAAITADQFAAELDFLSIGTNDLIQYTLAIDRVDDQVNYLYDPLHPAVLQLIRQVIEAGERAGKPVSMCGEMAGDVRYVPLLLGLGLREFSMPPNLLLEIRRCVINSRLSRLKKRAQALLGEPDAQVRASRLEKLNASSISSPGASAGA